MSLDDLQAQLRGTLDQQFAALKQKYEDAIADARRQAAADAERDVAVRLERARADWQSQLEAMVVATRAEAEQRASNILERQREEHAQALNQAIAQARDEHVQALDQAVTQARDEQTRAIDQAVMQARDEHAQALNQAVTQARDEQTRAIDQAVMQARDEHAQALDQALNQAVTQAVTQARDEHAQALDQAVTQAAAAARRTAELEFESERRRSQNELEAERQQAKTDAEAERQRARAELDGLRQRMQTEIAAARQTAAATAKPATPRIAAPGVPAAAFERVLAAIRDIDGARTLSQALESLLTHAGAAAGRAAIFLINGDRLKAWKASGIPDIDVQTVESSIGATDLLARAIQAGQATPSSASLPAPPFARLPADRAGLAVPLMIGGRAVAVLYADSGPNVPPAGSVDIVEALVRYASAMVALRTAMRTLDVLGGGAPDGPADGSAAGGGDVSDDQGARRYARLLVSEIKLYNEAAVRAGRQQRDLLQRLRAEIDRAQRLYEERVPPAVGGRHVYFHQELVQTLADGDPALLGKA